MRIDLFDQHTAVFGLKGSGKSNLIAHILRQPQYRNHLVYDVCREHGGDGVHRLIPEHRSGKKAVEEFDRALKRMVTENDRAMRPDLFVGEEASRWAPNSGAAPDALMDLIDLNRHYGVGVIAVARRPAKVDTNLVELADNLIVFSLRGKNDYRRLEGEAEGLGEAARSLGEYEFLVVDGMRNWTRCEPVPEYDTTGRL